eukprot:gnl/TRDRNA2_/TRDRNA2_123894_c0_seq1.p1 gnl/TRDRNA2_/TRDRNA2_123894_c0~~gnl/TRDRNA2_/TRDRNA2_123894_c0_seq1.p1  ORF type:complete len:256 (-),score=27.74 gnl/TRDRNA2_/TRDRNA2_123894_c0_seq1:12-779(-)
MADREGCERRMEEEAANFPKGAALAVECAIGCCVYYAINFFAGGREQLLMCFDVSHLLRFGPIGMLFGLSAVFSFLAQDALSPGTYALYAQMSVVVVPIVWRLCFTRALPVLTWVHILLIALGIVMYRVADLDHGESYDGLGMFWVSMKVCGTSLGTVWAEQFLKKDPNQPFNVQISYILPWKFLACLSTIWILPPHGLPDRPGGFFHDWSKLTLVIVLSNLGDTIMSAVTAKAFDSVVKAICGVVGIIFPPPGW